MGSMASHALEESSFVVATVLFSLLLAASFFFFTRATIFLNRTIHSSLVFPGTHLAIFSHLSVADPLGYVAKACSKAFC
uniref:Putative secreted protein n=1 Tax=Panstrongylus lignarius TaxID=156445 RepID=A0A224XT08_9HEMI